MSNLKEEILKEFNEKFVQIDPTGSKCLNLEGHSVYQIEDFLSSKLDEIEKEVMGLLPEETDTDIEDSVFICSEIKGYNSAIQTIREKLINYFK